MYIAESYIGIYRYQTTQPRNYRGCEFFLWTQLLGIKIGRCDLFIGFRCSKNSKSAKSGPVFLPNLVSNDKVAPWFVWFKGRNTWWIWARGKLLWSLPIDHTPFRTPKKKPKLSNHAPWIHCSSSMATSRHSRHYKVPSLSAPQLSCVLVNLGEFSLAEFLESIFRGSVYHSLYFLVFWHFMNTFSHFTLVFSSSLLKVAGRLVIRFMG